MTELPSRPVLLFAFATEDQTIHVEEEARAIQAALESVSGEAGLCDVELPPFLKLQDLVEVFQKNRNRVSVFHYAGHANGSELLLRTALGSGAGARGLSQIVGGQSGLKLVFLNGCSTERQVELWMAAGVPCVIATTQAVNGEVAKNFAARFYKGLATGTSIRTAYDEAVGEATAACCGNTRLLYSEDDSSGSEDAVPGTWPWFLRIAPGAELIEEWNLPEAAGDPLALLPVSVSGPLPAAPYPGLRRFTADDVSLFFGRGLEVRRLYERVTSRSSAPIVLLHGQSGVGKSSILEAGLIPRLQQPYAGTTAWDVSTIRLDPVRGVLDSLRLAFVEDLCDDDGKQIRSAEAWRRKEARTGRPLLVVLDQLEEAFTHSAGSSPVDWDRFVAELVDIFADRSTAPQGRLILSFRTEWFSRINSRLQGLWKSDVFLDCLDARGVREAIEGPTRRRVLRDHYSLAIENGLVDRIAAEVLADSEASVAPTLQILLKKLWDEAVRESRQPKITEALYRKHRGTLGDFVRQQIQAVTTDPSLSVVAKQSIDAGLLLDFLECHVTPELTSRHQTLKTLLSGDPQSNPPCLPRYSGRHDVIAELRRLCINHYLLIQPDSGSNVEPEPASRLAHDSLAVHVHNIYQASEAAGPRARRILEQRVAENAQGVHDELDGTSLKAIDEGLAGMRSLTPQEEAILRTGRKTRLIRRISIVSGVLIVILTTVMFQWMNYSSRLEQVFDAPPEQVSAGMTIAGQHPWISGNRAAVVFDQRKSDPDSRQSLRAAMVLVSTGQAKDVHCERVVAAVRSINSTLDFAEFLAIKQVIQRDVEANSKQREVWSAEFSKQFNAAKKPVVVTTLLLSLQDAVLVPPEWYVPTEYQETRTELILSLSDWLTLREIEQLIQNIDVGEAQRTAHLKAVLCLAMAEASEEKLRDWWSSRSATDGFDLSQLIQSPCATLHSAAALLSRRVTALTLGSTTINAAPASAKVSSQDSGTSFSVTYPGGKSESAEWATVRIQSAQLDFVKIPQDSPDSVDDVRPIWMSATEVDVRLFDLFRAESPECWSGISGRPVPIPADGSAPADNPATHVSWTEALNFCNWCSHRCGLPQCYRTTDVNSSTFECLKLSSGRIRFVTSSGASSFRLPTSQEWEHACRAASVTRYQFGEHDQSDGREILGRHAWFSENSWIRSPNAGFVRREQVCGSKLPNAWGLFDMLGNVQEWCWTSNDAQDQMLRSGSVEVNRHECISGDTTPVPVDLLRNNSRGNGLRLVIEQLPDSSN